MFRNLKAGLQNAGKSLESAGNSIEREIDRAAVSINRTVDGAFSSSMLDTFKTNNVIQLVSRSSGRALQIVMAPTGTLVVDGLGLEGPQLFHAHWTVIREGSDTVKLHNNFNFLSIINGCTVVVHNPNPASVGKEGKFFLKIVPNFICLESISEPGRHIGILNTGQLKSALATGREIDAQFAVRLIHAHTEVPKGAATGDIRVVQTVTVTPAAPAPSSAPAPAPGTAPPPYADERPPPYCEKPPLN